MEKNFLRILAPLEVYADHELSAKQVGVLQPNQLVSFNREKRRNGKNWMEIYLEDNTKAYIKKVADTFFHCKKVSLSDENALGFSYTQKKKPAVSVQRLFFPLGYHNSATNTLGTVKLRSVEDSKENKRISLEMEYKVEDVDVEKVYFTKGEQFYITNNYAFFFEVDSFKGKKGFLLNKTNTLSLADKWMGYFAVTVAILTAIGIFGAFLANGWIVVSGLMILAGFVVAAIMIFIMQIILLILKGVFNSIRKRF